MQGEFQETYRAGYVNSCSEPRQVHFSLMERVRDIRSSQTRLRAANIAKSVMDQTNYHRVGHEQTSCRLCMVEPGTITPRGRNSRRMHVLIKQQPVDRCVNRGFNWTTACLDAFHSKYTNLYWSDDDDARRGIMAGRRSQAARARKSPQ